jgi:uncharacterized DUF497 family protein
LVIQWDPWKASVNVRKYGISFVEAQSVFFDDEAILFDDPDHSAEEQRFLLLGLSACLRILVVSHTLRDGGRTIRIISARKATMKESEPYTARMIR